MQPTLVPPPAPSHPARPGTAPRQWLPRPAIKGQTSYTIKLASFVAAESLPWLDEAAMPALYDKTHAACPDCAVYREKRAVEWAIGPEAFGHCTPLPGLHRPP